jgi:hypothetical protein
MADLFLLTPFFRAFATNPPLPFIGKQLATDDAALHVYAP